MLILIKVSLITAIILILWKGIKSLFEVIKQSCLLVLFIAIILLAVLVYYSV